MPPGLPSSSTVIVIDIRHRDYSFGLINDRWPVLLRAQKCFCCGAVGGFSRHGDYRKYYYREQVRILRVRCLPCGVTHAVLPSFSLAGTSIGTEEAEQYLAARAVGESRGRAGAELLRLGVAEGYPKALEKMLDVAVSRGKALFAEGESEQRGLQWIEALCGPTAGRPLYAINRYCIEHRVNALCFSRVSILLCGRDPLSGGVSHNQHSAEVRGRHIDSG